MLIAALIGALRRARKQTKQLTLQAERDRAALEAAHDAAEHASAAKDRFVAMMSHEFRTPVNAVVAYADLLDAGVAGPVRPAQQQYIARMRTAGLHLLSLIDDILDLAKINAGRFDVHRGPVALGDATARAVVLVEPQAQLKGVHLEVQGSQDAIVCEGDVNRIRQIVVDLLSNAVKFTPPSGTVTLAWGASPGPGSGQAWVRVADTGVGVAPHDQARIFEPFEQVAHSALNRPVGGTGLGLAISRRLAQALGGDVDLDSDVGRGAVFTLRLAVTPAAAHNQPRQGDQP